MSYIPESAEKVTVDGATVDCFKLIKDGECEYYFDTSKKGPPHPMVNAMSCLKLIKGTNGKVVMFNAKAPEGLFERLRSDFLYEVVHLKDDLVKIIFRSVDSQEESDLTQTSCDG